MQQPYTQPADILNREHEHCTSHSDFVEGLTVRKEKKQGRQGTMAAVLPTQSKASREVCEHQMKYGSGHHCIHCHASGAADMAKQPPHP